VNQLKPCRHYIVAGSRDLRNGSFQVDRSPAARRHERDARAHIDSAYHYRSQPAERDLNDPMNENPEQNHESRNPGIYPPWIAGAVLLLAFLLRLWKASGTFLNLDEAMHALAANSPSVAEAYRASLGLAHPPLLILLLYYWQRLGTSELVLRLPSVIAGAFFCWMFFKWLTRTLGPVAGWTGFVLVCFLPPFIELSAEVRQYSLLLCFLIITAYVLELALGENSAGKMAISFFFLYLAMLTHYSAVFFAAAIGVYSIWRLLDARLSRRVVAIWIAGQAAALGLLAFLYRTHISNLKNSVAAQNMHAFLANSYFHRGRDHLLLFVFARTFGVLQYTFGQLAVGDVAGVLFIAGVLVLLNRKKIQQENQPSPRQMAIFLVLPFMISCAAAIMNLYPYGGTRHSALLMPFAVAGVSLAMVKLARQRWTHAVGGALLVVAICQGFGRPHRPYIQREDQRLTNMTQAIDAIQQRVQPGDPIFVDFQTSFLARFYLCPEVDYGVFSASGFGTYSCGGKRMIATSSETNTLTADTFGGRWKDMIAAYDLKKGQTVWIFQAGWNVGLARALQEKFPDFKYDSFGRNITLFKLTVGQPVANVKLEISH